MSFFSSISPSPRSRHYKGGHYGSNHYQRKGLLGNLVDAFMSGSSRNRYNNNYADPNININVNPNQPSHPQHQQSTGVALCTHCNAAVPSGSKFCLNCGAKVNNNPAPSPRAALFCPNCGDNLAPNARFCQKCGTKLNP